MKVNLNLGLSLTFVLTMTSLESVWSAATMFQGANQNSADTLGKESGLLVRRTRSYLPGCVSIGRLTELKTQFEDKLDPNHDGRADFNEVKETLQSFKANVSDAFVDSYIARRDQNENGAVDLIPEYVNEFVNGDYGEEPAREWFHLYDADEDGYFTAPEIRHVAAVMGRSPEAVVRYYIKGWDTNRDGRLDFSEFRWMY